MLRGNWAIWAISYVRKSWNQLVKTYNEKDFFAQVYYVLPR